MARSTLAIIAAGLGGWLLASCAFAANAGETKAVRVSYADLDLGKDAGVERLYARLQYAATEVCGRADMRDLGAFAREQACIAGSLDRAVDAVHSLKLSARHHGTGSAQLARRD